ncbi:MAG TPA: hypothetical protein VK797_03960 [Tepidisphaeraceae bacterium]|jgi:hypothetical protein|nr:hypothetical protein [Tepidisphaeraceae bacterium]
MTKVRVDEHQAPGVLHFVTFCYIGSLLVGCTTCPKGAAETPFKPNPPALLPMVAVVNAINANNLRIPTLWASLNYSATIMDNGKAHSVTSDDGILLYSHPRDFRLIGKKEFVGTVFDMGANENEFWLEVVPGVNQLWWGRFKDLEKTGPAKLPVDPEAVGEVLSVNTVDSDFLHQPVPVMQYDGAADCYVFQFNYQAPDRWFAQKQMWYERATLRPRRVVLYDASGKPVLDARLSHDVHVQVPNEPAAGGPLIAGDFRLFFPDSQSRMEFTLKDVQIFKDMGNGRHIPNPGNFKVPDVSGTDVRAIQIGADGVE